jgi:putative peptidoglycan lipid II flippase
LLTLPAAVALAVVPQPIISVLFERGAFTAADTAPTAWALAAFAVGLPAFVLNKVLSPAYFAREDTRTPMKYATVNMVVNVVLSVALFFYFRAQGWMPHLGIAVATSVAGWINAFQLWWGLRQRGEFAADARLIRTLPMILLSSVVMGVILWYGADALAPWLARTNLLPVRFGALAALVFLGLAAYAVLIFGTGVFSISALRGMIRRRRGKPKPPADDV